MEAQLQQLLDAQADALLSHLKVDKGRDEHNILEASPTSQKSGSGRATPVRQPIQRKLGVMGARKGIRISMQELWEVKETQAGMLHEAILEARGNSDDLRGWSNGCEALQRDIASISYGDQGIRVQELRQENASVQEEIQQLELKLSELKSRQRTIASQLSRLDNDYQSKLSSYKASLSILERRIDERLRKPTLTPILQKQDESAYLSLSPARRTVHLALDYLEEEQKHLASKYKLTTVEQEALDEGLNLWMDTVKAITRLEKHLRRQLRKLRATGILNGKSSGDGETEDTGDIFDETIQSLENNLKTAQEKRWNLLVCAIGAELEVLRQGAAMLPGTFPFSSNTISETTSVNDNSEIGDPELQDVNTTHERVESPLKTISSSYRANISSFR